MKKRIKSILFVLLTLIISACSNATVEEERTIILNVNSEVTPTFTSNYGNGTYDKGSSKYTHKINSIKDVYITLSYENLKTVTVYIPTSEMNISTIIKNVNFGEELDCEVEVTIQGVKTLEGIEFEKNSNILNLKLGKKNTFTFTLPTRDEDEQIKFTLPGYKEFSLDINKDLLVSGKAKISTIALHDNQMYVALDGVDYDYKIYSMSTNKMVTSGNKNSYEGKQRDYVLLPSNDSYYMYVYYQSLSKEKIYKIDGSTNFVLSGEEGLEAYGYLSLNSYTPFVIYDKTNKVISDAIMTNNISMLGLIVKNEEDKWVYIENVVTTQENSDAWNHLYEIDYTQSRSVEFNVTRIHNFTNEVISSGIESNFHPSSYEIDYIELVDNTFNVTIYENESYTLDIDLYDEEDNLMGSVPCIISEKFNGSIAKGTINYNGKIVPYQFPIFKEDIVYDNGNYSYLAHPRLNTQISLVEVIYMGENLEKNYLSDSAYVSGPDGVPILRTDTGENKVYFELVKDVEYTLYNNLKTYKFTLTEKDLSNGQIIIWHSKTKFTQLKLPNDYHIELANLRLYPDSNNIVEFPIANSDQDDEKNHNNICLSNGVNTICIQKEINENELIELSPFYVFDDNNLMLEDTQEYKTYSVDTNTGRYYYIDSISENPLICTNAHMSDYTSLTFSKSDFDYNQDLKANYYSFEENAKYVINGLYHPDMKYDQVIYVSLQKVYIMSGDIISYMGVEYDLSTYGSKELNITIVEGELNIEPIK